MNNWETDKRFEEVYKQGGALSQVYKVVVDRETGVEYLTWHYGSASGLTVLVDRDGKPLVHRP